MSEVVLCYKNILSFQGAEMFVPAGRYTGSNHIIRGAAPTGRYVVIFSGPNHTTQPNKMLFAPCLLV